MEPYAEPEDAATDATDAVVEEIAGEAPSLEQILEDFVRPFYAERDTLHGLPHIRRVVKKARYLARHHVDGLEPVVLLHAAYLHGLIFQEELRIRRFLQARELPPELTERVVRAAREAHTQATDVVAGDGDVMTSSESRSLSVEGAILHDARLLEGGRTFLIASALVRGATRGATLEEIVATIEDQMLGRFRCYLPAAQRLYAEKEAFARAFLDDLGPQL